MSNDSAFYSFRMGNTFVMQFRCIAHQIEWQSLIKEGVIDIEDTEQFYAKL